MLTTYTALNMLLGVLCQVFSSVSELQREKTAVQYVRSTVLDVLLQIDMENQGMVDKDEFDELLEDERILEALSVLGVDVEHPVSISEHVFKDSAGSFTTELTYGDLLDLVLSLRSDNKASVMDLVELRKLLITTYKRQ